LRRTLLVALSLAFLLVTCKPATPQGQAKPAPIAATVDSLSARPGDVCPPPDTVSHATSTLVAPDTVKPKKKISPVDTTRKPAAQVSRETSAVKADMQKPAALPRLWDFGSETCIPCKTMMAILNPMMQEFAGKVDVRIINVYKDQALASQYRIQIIPTQVFMDASGKELYRHVGAFPRDSILLKFKELGFAK
jgi:thioredoxin 1